MNILIIRTNGKQEQHQSPDLDFRLIEKLIGASVLDHANLRKGQIMFVDDLGHSKKLPVNKQATALYHSVCIPGTIHQIVGDVALIQE